MSTRGARLETSGWTPCEKAIAFAKECGLDHDQIWAQFSDYWTAKSGANATKLDWLATWRNWCRKAKADRSRGISNRFERRDDNRMPTRPAMIWVGGRGYGPAEIIGLRRKRSLLRPLEWEEREALKIADGQ